MIVYALLMYNASMQRCYAMLGCAALWAEKWNLISIKKCPEPHLEMIVEYCGQESIINKV